MQREVQRYIGPDDPHRIVAGVLSDSGRQDKGDQPESERALARDGSQVHTDIQVHRPGIERVGA
jgi:hypothetical protein